MGHITIFTKEGCGSCRVVRSELNQCHLPFDEIVLDAHEPQNVPEIYFDNHPVPGGVDELLNILQKWEVVQGSDGRPTLEPIPSSRNIVQSYNDNAAEPHNDRWISEKQRGRSRDHDHYPEHQHRHPEHYDDHHQHHQHHDEYPHHRHDSHSNGAHPRLRDKYRDNGYREEENYLYRNNDCPPGEGRHYRDEGYDDYHHRRPDRRHIPRHHEDNYHEDPHHYHQREQYPHEENYPDSHRHERDQYPRADPFHAADPYSRGDPYYEGGYAEEPYNRENHHASRGNAGNDPYGEHHGSEHYRDHRNGSSWEDQHRGHENFREPYHGRGHRYRNDLRISSHHGRDGFRDNGNNNNNRHHHDRDSYAYSNGAEASQSNNMYNAAQSKDRRFGRGDSFRNSPIVTPSQPSRRDRFRNRNSYQRHSFHGSSLLRQAQQQQVRADKYQDDENPFLRRGSGNTVTSAAIVPTTPPVRREMQDSSSRRDNFGKEISYQRHSFHGKTLLEQEKQRLYQESEQQQQQHQQEEQQQQQQPVSKLENQISVSPRRAVQQRDSFDRSEHADNSVRGGGSLNEGGSSVRGGGGSLHGGSSIHGGSTRGGGSVHGGSRAGSTHSRRSFKLGLDLNEEHSLSSNPSHSDEDTLSHDDDDNDNDFNEGSLEDDDGTDNVEGDEDPTEDSYCNVEELNAAMSRLRKSGDGSQDNQNQGVPARLSPRPSRSNSRSDLKVSLNNSRSDLRSLSRKTSQSDLQNTLQGSNASLSTDDLVFGKEESEHGTPSSDKPKATRIFALGDEGKAVQRFSRSFRQDSSKSLKTRTLAGRASSMRYLGAKTNDTGSNTSSGLDSRSRRRKTLTGGRSLSPTPPSGIGQKSPTSGLRTARTAGLQKVSCRMSNHSTLNSSNNSMSSTSSLWSNSPGPAMKEDKRTTELPFGRRIPVLDAIVELQRIIPLGSLKYNLTTYHNSFTGTTLIDTFQESYRISRSEAEHLGKSLCASQILSHVCGDHGFEDTSKYFFRLQCHQTPEILNSFCIWQDEISLTKNAGEVMDEVMGKLLEIMATVTDSVKGRVHYSRATKHHEDMVTELDYAICELQMVKLARLDKKNLLAFGLNVFQLFLHYAFIKVGIPSSSSAHNSFWTSLKFNVGGDLYSFSDWWNGICRGNRKGPYGPKPFQGKDPRCFLNLPDPVDPRIHFASGMTLLMRPMLVYSGANIDNELEHVARIYCQNVEFVWMEITSNTMSLAPQFQTYQVDFASSTKALPKVIMKWLQGKEKAHVDEMTTIQKKIKVEFFDNVKSDGWNEHAGEHFQYQSAPKANHKVLQKKTEPRREVKRQGSLKSLFRLEGTAAS